MNRSHRRSTCDGGRIVPFAILLVFAIPASASAQPPIAETADLIQAQKQRTDAVRTLDVSWDARTFYSPHYGEMLSNTPFDQKTAKPPTRDTFRATYVSWEGRLVMDGLKIRHENSLPIWSFPDGRFIERRRVECFDGVEYRKSQEDVDPVTEFPKQGYIRSRSGIGGMLDLRMLLLYARPLRDETQLEKYMTGKPAIARDQLDGLECMTLTSNKADARSTSGATVWFCPAQDWCVRKLVMRQKGSPLREMQMRYSKQDDDRWVPTEWRWDEFDWATRLIKSTTYRVTNWAVNQECDPAEFTIAFSPGTLVEDQRAFPLGGLPSDKSSKLDGDSSNRGKAMQELKTKPARPVRYFVLRDGSEKMMTSRELRAAGSADKVLAAHSR